MSVGGRCPKSRKFTRRCIVLKCEENLWFVVVACWDVFELGIFTCLGLGGATGAASALPLLHLFTQPPFSPSSDAAVFPKEITYCHKTAQLCAQ